MITLTKEQISEKLNRLAQISDEAEALYNELVNAGAIELTEEQLATVSASGNTPLWLRPYEGHYFTIPGFEGTYFIF